MTPQIEGAPEVRVDAPPQAAAGARRSSCDVLVIGGGLAGLAAALRAAEHTDVTLIARVPLSESNSAWAQGGIAAALGPEDSPRAHVADTLVAGAGLSDGRAVGVLAGAAPELMRELAAWGVPFERDSGGFALGLEGGHSQRRILHVGDATGWAVTSVLAQLAARHPRIRILDTLQAVALLGEGACQGVLAQDSDGRQEVIAARATVLATGGAGALYSLSSNPAGALGEGIAIAYRAGASVADMEFVQFHPTVLRTREGQGFLITEAARGEGGRLLTPAGRRFMPEYDPRAELAPRDVVTRGIFRAMREDGCDHVLLDLTALGAEFLARRFPTIVARLRAEGIDPAREPIPVAPAAHYLMGGVRTDLQGATDLPGLFAAGECACTGVHGANRLASNSLLECLVFGRRAADAALRIPGASGPSPAEGTQAAPAPAADTPWRELLQAAMDSCVGPVRSGAGLAEGLARLDSLPLPEGPRRATAANAALAARLIAASALARRESRGGHFRTDFPASDEAWRGHTILRRGAAPTLAPAVAAGEPAVRTRARAAARPAHQEARR